MTGTELILVIIAFVGVAATYIFAYSQGLKDGTQAERKEIGK